MIATIAIAARTTPFLPSWAAAPSRLGLQRFEGDIGHGRARRIRVDDRLVHRPEDLLHRFQIHAFAGHAGRLLVLVVDLVVALGLALGLEDAISRRRRRAKTDRIDGETLLRALLAHKRGEPRVCSMVRAPTPEDEYRRRICRERKVLIMERVQHVNRIKGSQGASGYEPLRRDRRARLDALQTGDGRRLLQHLKAQICRELDLLELLLEQIKAVEAERDAPLDAEQTKASAPPAMLLGVHGVGPEFASVLWSEGLSRHFDNRRQVAAYAGLAPTPWQSGSVNREQGISQSGNRRLRATMIQLAWLWLRHQPGSALPLWFKDRIERNGGRRRKTTIVALARKLLVALWKYVSAGVVMEGAMIRAA